MKFWKNTLISAFAFVGVSTTVLYTACEKDSCLDLRCKNEAPCVDGFCQCPQGYEGTDCNDWASARFTGRYDGTSVINDQPFVIDSAMIESVERPDVISFRFLNAKGDSKIYQGRVKGSGFILKDDATGDSFELTENKENITVVIKETVNGKLKTTNFAGYKK